MSIQALAQQFVDLCNQRKNFDVMQTMYDPGIVSVESSGNQTVGQANVIEKSKKWASGLTIHGEKVLGPYFHGEDQFAVHFTFEVTPNDTGKRVSQNEVAIYTVKNGKIVREQFFYQGKW